MGHMEGSDRDRMTLFPEALDDSVSQENPVRFIDAFAAGLDLERLGFTHAVPGDLGRPPYNPADLLRLYIYGYLNRIRSSRQLEREANRNVELMWLLRRLVPDFPMVPGPSARPSPTSARTTPRPSAASAASSSATAASFASSGES
jgi:transposase